MLLNKKIKKKLLLVGDDTNVSFAEQQNLKKLGYNVLTACSGEESIIVVDKNHIDLILLDIQLGNGIDGIETSKIILKNHDIPIIFFSSQINQDIARRIEHVQAYGYVLKNSDIMLLDTSIKMALKLFDLKQINELENRIYKKTIHSLEQYRRISKIGYWEWNMKSGDINCSDELYSIFSLDKNSYNPSIESFLTFIHPDNKDYIKQTINKILKEGISIQCEFRIIRNDGVERKLNTIGDIIEFDKDNFPHIMIGVIQDITEQKELQESLTNQNILMNELLHRIKNNLAMISSMLSLMQEKTTSNESLSMLNEIKSKINAISEMYKLLNYSIDHTQIPLDEYIRNITAFIIETSSNLTFKTNLDKIFIPSKKAIPLGIILNELITNIIKHAYIGNESGNVFVRLKRNKKNAVLEVKDNGIGLPDGFEISKLDSLGITLINLLTQQIDGNVKFESKDGTRCVLKFPLN